MEKIEELVKAIEASRNSLSTDRLDMSFGEVMNMYERQEIIIDPEFQRLFRWNSYQQTRLIESILIGIPIPPFFVAEDSEGRWEVVDGLQRISTILSFFGILKQRKGDKNKNNWLLGEGDIIKDLNQLSCKDLPLKLQLNIKRASCRVEIIKWNSKFDMRYELFNRLNTGGSDLADQEIRNAIFRGAGREFNDFLKKNACEIDFCNLVEPTDRQLEQLYMEELVLRFCSLYDYEQFKSRNTDTVENNISQLMTNYMKYMAYNPENINNLDSTFNRTINVLMPLGKSIFRASNNIFSTSLYDCIMFGIAKNIDNYERMRTDEIFSKINTLKDSTYFQRISKSASARQSRIMKRLEIASEIFG